MEKNKVNWEELTNPQYRVNLFRELDEISNLTDEECEEIEREISRGL